MISDVQIKAIETDYHGVLFRSRLEARWAVFFDALGVKWEYEKEGFDIDGVRYLPDFYIPHIKTWVEIKPNQYSAYKFEKFAESLPDGERAVLMTGAMEAPIDGIGTNAPEGLTACDSDFRWCECPDCGFIGIEYDGRSDRLPCKMCMTCQDLDEGFYDGNLDNRCFVDESIKAKLASGECPKHGKERGKGCKRHSANKDKYYNANSHRLIAAYTAAKHYRLWDIREATP